MTNNKTELQNSLDRYAEGEETIEDMRDICQAAKAYANLPETIEGMKGKCDVANRDYNAALDDILKLIKEG